MPRLSMLVYQQFKVFLFGKVYSFNVANLLVSLRKLTINKKRMFLSPIKHQIKDECNWK